LESTSTLAQLAQLATNTRLFKGAEDSPLLAPRGVYLVNNQLFVADTAQNRLFIWNELPTTEFQKPDVVLGQVAKAATGRNSKVLIWLTMPTEDGQPADVVIGQPDFHHNDPNVKGVGSSPTSQSLNWPYGVFSDGKQLWIADTGNRRVLYYKDIPSENYAAADKVFGKPTFKERDYENNDPIWPYSVKVSPNGQMAITDTQYYRVLIWHDWTTAETQKADVIIGQESFEGNGQNQFNWFPKANTLNWCYDTCFYKEGLWVADTGSSRVLWFDKIPTEHNTPAVNLFGQDNFNTGSENKNTIWSTEGSMYWPFQICIENQTMVIVDTGNHRVIIKELNF